MSLLLLERFNTFDFLAARFLRLTPRRCPRFFKKKKTWIPQLFVVFSFEFLPSRLVASLIPAILHPLGVLVAVFYVSRPPTAKLRNTTLQFKT